MTISHDINPGDDLQTTIKKLKVFADLVTTDANVATVTDAANLALGIGATPATVAATGTVQADAASIAVGFTLVSGADAAKGVKLPAAAAGKMCYVKNNAAAILKVWPNTDDAINAIAANSNIAMASLTSAIYYAYDATTWYTIPLLPS